MADLTPDTIATAATQPLNATVDGLAASAVPIPDQIAAMQVQKAAAAAAGTNRRGGPRSAWGLCRPARAVTEGP